MEFDILENTIDKMFIPKLYGQCPTCGWEAIDDSADKKKYLIDHKYYPADYETHNTWKCPVCSREFTFQPEWASRRRHDPFCEDESPYRVKQEIVDPFPGCSCRCCGEIIAKSYPSRPIDINTQHDMQMGVEY